MGMLESLAAQLKKASSVILTTHRNSDGDGLGAQMALLLGLQQLGKQAWIVNPDRPPKKYAFLDRDGQTRVHGQGELPRAELAIVLDTNDRRLVEPLISELEGACEQVLFIDHHPALAADRKASRSDIASLGAASVSSGSVIDISAASTGEIVYRLLPLLGVHLTADIARALYTSVVFDTQLFRYVKSDPRSHEMAAELLKFEKNPETIHRRLFATYTVEKMRFMTETLSSTTYSDKGQIAFIQMNSERAAAAGFDPEESADIIDFAMNVESVEVAALLREDATGSFKISFRSKGRWPVLPIAESYGGGGHPFASGAYVKSSEGANSLGHRLLESLRALVQS